MSAPTTPLVWPPLQGDELTTLTGFLDYFRVVVRRKAEGLPAAELDRPLAPTTMTLGGMLKHLTLVEHHWFTRVLLGEPMPAPWDAVDWTADPDWDWHSAGDDEPARLFALYDEAVARSRAVVREVVAEDGVAALDRLSVRPSRRAEGRMSLRWILVHMVEEYARHAGHADLLREAVDGTTGD